MTTDATLESVAESHADMSGADSAVHVDRAIGMLRAHLLERTVRNDWDEKRAHEVAQAIVTCLRESADFPVDEPNSHATRLSRDCLRHALRFIHQNLDTDLSWVQIASAVGLAPFSFGRSFKVTTGLTPYQYVIRCRIRKAMNLLATSDQSICDIALDVGCSCQSHLTTLFRKHTGTTPGAFRAASRRGGRRPMAAPAPVASVPASRFA
ncbi:MAG TPA: AraC family transcriptional regulator [Paraburkholderia sp.]|uniref:helix-turn-helix transcriptional regulator n=1 Tax=Paraburkholderia sp. TaxID=1926495 RepID=UPI002C013ABB|nr:AraC family transcriptional regulator [Paraburkholderia sp.]HTR07041.1 AraC family transcriptional regulator [Paraburkholderia sp.]